MKIDKKLIAINLLSVSGIAIAIIGYKIGSSLVMSFYPLIPLSLSFIMAQMWENKKGALISNIGIVIVIVVVVILRFVL